MKFETLLAVIAIIVTAVFATFTNSRNIRARVQDHNYDGPAPQLLLQAPGEGESDARDSYLPPGQDSASAVAGWYGSSVTTAQ
jgi:hypothetical protein